MLNTQADPKPDLAAIRADLEYMTARWGELPERAMFEIRAFKEGSQPQTFKYAVDWMDDAIGVISDLNQRGYNLYAVRNPIRETCAGSAKDTDIIAAFFLWADCDDPAAAGNVLRFDGPKWSAAVTTGTTPSTRAHVYWSLQDPCHDLAQWRDMQSAIAAHFGSDASVINPSRIMRIGGTVSWPFAKKRERGYVSELTTLRTEYADPRPAVTLDQMQRVFAASIPAKAPLQQTTAETVSGFQIDTGERHGKTPEEYADILRRARTDGAKHGGVRDLTSALAGMGVSRAMTEAIVRDACPVWDAGVEKLISTAYAKYYKPNDLPEFVPTPDASTSPDAAFPTPYDMFDESAVDPRHWLYGRHYLRKFVSVLASAGGVGKTSMQIVEALALCTGRPLLGEEVHERCNVWLINLEDPLDEMQRRILAAMKFYGIKPEEVRGRLFVNAGREFAITFAVQTREGVTPNKALVEYLIKRIPELEIGATFIDPFVGAHMINENDNMAVNAVVAEIRKVADQTNSAIGLVHHIRKGNGEDASIDSVRGAGSLIGAARAARVVNKVTAEAAANLGIDAKTAVGLFRVDDGKANLAPPAVNAVFRRMEGIQIANGDWVGVAAPFKLPDEWGGMDDETVNEMLRMMDLGIADPDGNEEYYSLRPQDKERWVGNIILTYPFDNPDHAKNLGQAKKILQTWQNNGLLEEFEYRSAKQRKDRKGVRSLGRVGEQK